MATIFEGLPQEKREEILKHAGEFDDWQAAVRYAREVGLTPRQLDSGIKKYRAGLSKKTEKEGGSRRELDAEEELFLERVRAGDVGLDEASRKVASLVFKKMLENPDDVRFGDFFKVEFLKIKQTEVQDKKNAATDMIHAMFGGKLPPKICPQCGYKLVGEPLPIASTKVEAIEGEIVDE